MLAQLDRRLAKGEIDHATYEARRENVMEMIRKGRAFVLSPLEKAIWGAFASLLIITGFGTIARILSSGGTALFGTLISVALIVYGLNRLMYVLRH